MKILMSGGGTLGPVTPLLALSEIIKEKYPQAEFIWVGTKNGPEKELIEKYGIKFIPISSGKLRRYFSILNILDWFKIKIAFWQALFLILKEKPDLAISFGGYVSVPVHLASWFHGVPTWIHQQDARVGLANKIMAPMARIITVALKSNLINFNPKKTFWLGNPVRADLFFGSKAEARKLFNLEGNLPVVLALGGGTGSQKINELIIGASQHLENICQIIHLTGLERSDKLAKRAEEIIKNYQAHKFLGENMKHAYAIADIVVARGGFGTLSELAALSKTAIIIPMPGHQEENINFLAREEALIEMKQEGADSYKLAKIIQELLENRLLAKQMGKKLNQLLPPAKKEDVMEILKMTNK